MSVKAILFDADGVVVNPSFQFAKLLAEHYGITRQMTKRFFEGVFNECLLGKADLKDVLSPFLPEWGWKGTVDEFVRTWLKADHVTDMRIVNAIGELRKQGLLCCLATNQEHNRANYMRKEMGFEKVFDRLFFSCELGCQKPDPAYFHVVRHALRLEPNELFFWDDDPKNVEAARNCGWEGEVYTGFEAFGELVRIYEEKP